MATEDKASADEPAPKKGWAAIPLRWRIFAITAPLTIIADQVTKVWARASLEVTATGMGKPVPVIENFWEWRLSQNPGSAFGLFNDTSGARIFLSIIGVIAVGAIVWMLRKARDDQRRLAVALGLVAGGAVGNLWDRIVFGQVTDFVVWKYYEKEWPTFNVADVALVLGVIMLFFDMGKEETRAKADDKAKAGGKGKGGAGKKRAAEKS
jgi:signal peptidase II